MINKFRYTIKKEDQGYVIIDTLKEGLFYLSDKRAIAKYFTSEDLARGYIYGIKGIIPYD